MRQSWDDVWVGAARRVANGLPPFTETQVDASNRWSQCAVGEHAPKLGKLRFEIGGWATASEDTDPRFNILDSGRAFTRAVGNQNLTDAVLAYGQVLESIRAYRKKYHRAP